MLPLQQHKARHGLWLLSGTLLASAVACSDQDAGKPATSGHPRGRGGTASAAGEASNDPTPTRAGQATSPGAGTGGVPSAGGSFAMAGADDSGNPPTETSAAGEGGGGLSAGLGGTGHIQGGAGGQGAGGQGTAGQGAGGQGAGGQGAAGQNTAGQGAAGQGTSAPSAEACVECGAQTCTGVLDACANSPDCSDWLDCFSACNSDTCASACDASFARASRLYYGIYACLCGSCQADCQVAPVCNKQCQDESAIPPTTAAPATLAETGLFTPASAQSALPTIAPGVETYSPSYALWADGAGKERYVYIPACATIDTRDADHWEFPVGTRLWKNFRLGDDLLETRMIHRYGAGASDWLYATYGWDLARPNDPTAAVAVLHGAPNAGGTIHDIPDPWECGACHGKLPDKPLGFSAIQLSHGGAGLTMQKLSDWGWLTVPARDGFEVPGTPVQKAALGYLHANCGGCHNSRGELPRDNPMLLRLLVGQKDYAQTDTVITTIGVPTLNAAVELHGKPRIDPQQPTNSAIFLRMSNRDAFPMPPIATKVPDTDGGIAAVRAWIDAMPKP